MGNATRGRPPLRDGLALGLGPRSTAWLAEIGVLSTTDLVRVGSVAAFEAVKSRHPEASLNLLWALEAAIDGRDWREVARTERARLVGQLSAGVSSSRPPRAR